MPTEKDLFAEEQAMPSMSFGDHIEDLRRRLVLALLGLFVGVLIAFIPYLNLGKRVLTQMQDPAQRALDAFYMERTKVRANESLKAIDELNNKSENVDQSTREARTREAFAGPYPVRVAAEDFAGLLHELAPELKLPAKASLKDRGVTLAMTFRRADLIELVHQSAEPKSALISLAPLETFMMYFMVCLVTGLVLTSPWVFYQIWAFVAAGLYRHERHYVTKFLPFSLGLFLGGVFLCFYLVLPYTLQFLLDFNIWLGIEPTLRITDWISFATILPLVFGICFQTPLVMLLLERIGIFTPKDFREKRKFAIIIIVVAAAVITPTGDPFTMMILAVPMYALYELGIVLIGRGSQVPAAMEA